MTAARRVLPGLEVMARALPGRAAREEPGAALDETADAVHRLAVLLAAGLEPMAALRLLDDSPQLTAAAARGSPLDAPETIVSATGGSTDEVRRGWRYLAVCWAVATETGAPLAGVLERAAETLRALADADRQVDLALAGPLATARIVALLPLAGVALALLIGADPVGVVVGTVPGAVSAALGAAALAAGIRWNRRLVAAARVTDPLAGLGHELLALAMSGGAAPDAAQRRVERAAARCGLDAPVADARATLDFAARAGVPAAALLRAEAARARRRALADVLRRAALLGSRLLAPLGVCFLPAFVLLGVVPLMIGILRGALAAF
ncbi:type II secretion system F family protein [Protaetiibacter sp. SSC-01]|uniref:type II secretion system F family protein n=1 Tax=Protaetiibacter sp. SSC-01 TaxID=2759943 RepID=UPI0016569BF8|nr:type II secretion system F family protein [Protaetiibacter sp. SSC-01]QNO37110.1 type II secretion system F family protein [Protaetiibacter sp. SSC-01]